MALISAPSMIERRAQGDVVAADRAADQALLLGKARGPGADAELGIETLPGALVLDELQRADQADARASPTSG